MTNEEQGKIQWAHWPKDHPLPTKEELAKAHERYWAKMRQHPEDTSDLCSGLDFVMLTACRLYWWEFFFPDEPCPEPQFFSWNPASNST